jgi:hypothetical protein
MTILRPVFYVFTITLIAIGMAGDASAQTSSTDPLRLVVPCAAGTANDLLARAIAQALADTLSRRVEVENLSPNAEDAAPSVAAPADDRTAIFRFGDCPEDERRPATAPATPR